MRRTLAACALSGLVWIACTSDQFVGPDATADACTDPTFCEDKCGTGLANACGVSTDCRTDCGANKTCDGVTHKCICSSDGSWCSNRCGLTTDNCGNAVNCGACESGTCTNNACNCTPDTVKQTCTSQNRVCGPAVNNCSQNVDCGPCLTSQNCQNGLCCNDDSLTCASKCGKVTNNCGKVITCAGCANLNQICCNNQCVLSSVCTDASGT